MLLFVLIALIGAAIATTPFWLDRVIVYVMRTCRIYAYPLAIRIAYSLETQEDDWALKDDELSHSTIGKIVIRPSIIIMCLPDTNQSRDYSWVPSWIEQRIIRNAANALIVRRRSMQLDRVLPRLPGW